MRASTLLSLTGYWSGRRDNEVCGLHRAAHVRWPVCPTPSPLRLASPASTAAESPACLYFVRAQSPVQSLCPLPNVIPFRKVHHLLPAIRPQSAPIFSLVTLSTTAPPQDLLCSSTTDIYRLERVPY